MIYLLPMCLYTRHREGRHERPASGGCHLMPDAAWAVFRTSPKLHPALQRGPDLVLANPLSCLLVRGSGPIIGSAAILATLACSEASRSES